MLLWSAAESAVGTAESSAVINWEPTVTASNDRGDITHNNGNINSNDRNLRENNSDTKNNPELISN